jgi:hypothetical protein
MTRFLHIECGSSFWLGKIQFSTILKKFSPGYPCFDHKNIVEILTNY